MRIESSVNRVMLSYTSSPKLSPEEYRSISEAKRHLGAIKENLAAGEEAFKGLSFDQKQELLAYLTFSKENSYTRVEKGHTPIEDSARDLIRDKGLYSDHESLDKALVHILNKYPNKPFSQKLVQDALGVVRAAG